MRTLTAFVAVLIGALLLGSCGEKQAGARYDLTTESNQKFLADNAVQKGVITLPSGLQYRIINSGRGKRVTSGSDIVTVSYKGWTIDGHVFDRTQAGRTASFAAGQLIPGWVEALKLMREGDEWQLVIPAELGYGAEGAGADIPPNQTLVFNMQLLVVKPPQAQ